MSSDVLNSSFNIDNFLAQHWQRKAVYLPGLLPEFVDPITPEELAGLACEEFIESRLIQQVDKSQFQLTHGPISESIFQSLPEENWTVLVQAVDQWSESVAELKAAFSFIPSWRVDDVMVSYAAPQGGAGPHFDFYDVFLIQGLGQRTWRVGESCPANAPIVADNDLRILQNFNTVDKYILNPGDALYLPPGVSHWGTADSESLCYSLGFRAPSMAEMLEGFSDALIARASPDDRFISTSDGNGAGFGEIQPNELEAPLQRLLELIDDKAKFQKWFGCHVTTPKYPELVQKPNQQLQQSQLQKALANGGSAQRHPCSRFAYLCSQEYDALLFFADGGVFELPLELAEAASKICELSVLNNESCQELATQGAVLGLLLELINQGRLILD